MDRTDTSTLAQPQVVLAIFDQPDHAQAAVRELQGRGIPKESLSVLVRHDETNITAQQMVDLERESEATGTAVALGGTVGGLAGLLGGLAAFSIPGIGPFLGAGVLATTIGGVVLGSAAGERAVHFKDFGLSDDRSSRYGSALQGGSVIVAVQARGADEVMLAREALALHQADEIDVQPTTPGA